MPEQPPLGSPVPAGVQASLHAIAEVLRDPQPLSLETREVLADLMDELGSGLATAPVPPAEVAHLAKSAAQLVQAVHRQAAPGLLEDARRRLDVAILAAESKAPLIAGLARRLLDALANIGI
ncbi:MAG TPA: hypothetical protein VN688_32215 [Gemmataceae bacterium]|nr:hypothetical protein [Gemmataceae bacterium]